MEIISCEHKFETIPLFSLQAFCSMCWRMLVGLMGLVALLHAAGSFCEEFEWVTQSKGAGIELFPETSH